MTTLLKQSLTPLYLTVLLGLIVCGLYPLIVWGGSQLLFPHQANGSLIESADRRIVGSSWLGQNFTAPKYFHPRPSSAGTTGYDAANSGGSNFGPTSQKFIDGVKQHVADYRTENNLSAETLVPGDAVTGSGSGLDPHISPRNADLQTARVAKARGVSEETVRTEVTKATAGAQFGFLGEAGVNVLELNLALDKLPPK